MKKILCLFIIFIIFLAQVSHTYGALNFTGKECSYEGYAHSDGEYYYQYTYGGNWPSYSCRKIANLGSKAKIYGKKKDYLISDNGIYNNGKGIKYAEIPREFLTLLLWVIILYIIHFLLFHSLKYIKKYMFLRITLGSALVLMLCLLPLTSHTFAYSVAQTIHLYYDGRIIGLIFLCFIFSLLKSFIEYTEGMTYENNKPNNILLSIYIIIYIPFFIMGSIVIYSAGILWMILSILIFIYYIKQILKLYKVLPRKFCFENGIIIFFVLSLLTHFMSVASI